MKRPPVKPAGTAGPAADSGPPPAEAGLPAPAAPRRRGRADSKTRDALIEATAQLMLDEGHTAVTARRVAAAAGVHPGLLHYYFDTMDELVLAVFRQGAEANLRRQARALSSPHPLRSLWQVNRDRRGVKLLIEFIALSGRNEAIRTEVAAYSVRFREAEKQAIERLGRQRGDDNPAISPAAASVLIDAIARLIALEESLGVTDGHADMIALVEEHLGRFDSDGQDEETYSG
jgi:AcrR family transcriptional regulator